MVTWLSPSKSFLISGAMSPLQTSYDHTFKEELPSFWILDPALHFSQGIITVSHHILYLCMWLLFPSLQKRT